MFWASPKRAAIFAQLTGFTIFRDQGQIWICHARGEVEHKRNWNSYVWINVSPLGLEWRSDKETVNLLSWMMNIFQSIDSGIFMKEWLIPNWLKVAPSVDFLHILREDSPPGAVWIVSATQRAATIRKSRCQEYCAHAQRVFFPKMISTDVGDFLKWLLRHATSRKSQIHQMLRLPLLGIPASSCFFFIRDIPVSLKFLPT